MGLISHCDRARTPGPLQRSARFARRHPVATLSLVGLLGVASVFAALLVDRDRALGRERAAVQAARAGNNSWNK